jgi:hypothetical protein
MDSKLEVNDFSGGIKDSFVGAPPNKGKAFTNLTIRPDLKTESRFGSEVFDPTHYQVPFTTTRKRADSIYRFKSSNIYQTQGKLYHINAGFVEITGPSGNSCFPSTAVEFDQCGYAEWNNHLLVACDRRLRPQFIYKDGSNYRVRTIGLPKIDPSGITFTAGSGLSRKYVFVHVHTYTIDGTTFTQRSAVSATRVYTSTIPNSIGSIPVLANGAVDNYDTSNVKIEIYRTKDAESTFFKVGEVTNGTTTFSDSVADSSLDTGLLLYTDADDLDYDQPAKCKYVVQLNGVAYYLNIEDSLGGIYPNRLVQANADQIYAANEGNICDFDEDITGAGVAGQYVIVFTRNRTYRLEGTYDSTGAGGISKVEISRTSGCVAHKSITQVLDGIYYAATDGFYFTNGFQVQKISEDIPETYREIVASETIAKRIYGTYDPFEKIVYWSASDDVTDDDNGIILAAHTYFGIRPDVPFTKFDGGYWPENFTASSLLFHDGVLVRSTTDGVLLKHYRGLLNDIKVNPATAASTWTQLPVIYDYTSPAFDFGDITKRKWVTRFITYCDSIAKVSFTIFSNNDNTNFFRELAEVKSNSPILWGDSFGLWGDEGVRWNFLPIVSANRRFPSNGLRCSYKQIKITNAYTEIESSVSMGLADVNATAKTVTLLTAGVEWDVNSVDYFISFSTDNYALEYKVSARTPTVLTVEDPSSLLVTASGVGFRVNGYRKNEAIRLLGYSMVYQYLTPSQTPYRK